MKALVAILVVVGVLGILVAVNAVAQEGRTSSGSGFNTGSMDFRELVVEFNSSVGGEPLRLSRCKLKVAGDWVQIETRGSDTTFIPREAIKSITGGN
ncbi:MAG: hypothetical protein JXL80_03250 [Planctomycetes bacterium]|nr:hypothetical protein [Planctomycetota bacterium]